MTWAPDGRATFEGHRDFKTTLIYARLRAERPRGGVGRGCVPPSGSVLGTTTVEPAGGS
jgi:hypothetical protein